MAQFWTESVAPPARDTPLTSRIDDPVVPKSTIEDAVTERLPNVSLVPLSLSVPPFRTMLIPLSLKLAPSVRVDPALSVSVPVPERVPAS